MGSVRHCHSQQQQHHHHHHYHYSCPKRAPILRYSRVPWVKVPVALSISVSLFPSLSISFFPSPSLTCLPPPLAAQAHTYIHTYIRAYTRTHIRAYICAASRTCLPDLTQSREPGRLPHCSLLRLVSYSRACSLLPPSSGLVKQHTVRLGTVPIDTFWSCCAMMGRVGDTDILPHALHLTSTSDSGSDSGSHRRGSFVHAST